MQKLDTIAATMLAFMERSPSIEEFPNYKTLNDAVGAAHGLPAGKVQVLAGEKAWKWTPDTETGVWRKATEEEVEACRAKAATKNHGGPRSKVLSDEDRAALEAQVKALEAVDNPALAGLLADLRGKVIADDLARKGSLKDRLATALEKMGLELAVKTLESLIVAIEAEIEADATAAAEAPAAEA